ncbi:MAG: glycine cleavage system aminomethyltransferase GcvT [Gammaproteobacteria bacterium]|nr:glycine cleavage system aminomethyltransferase GcvT [Gammaproteobacteria bacterium]
MAGRTPLFDAHVRARARMVPFTGWEMPLHYGSQVAEHHAVRTDAGMFDVSHMSVTDVSGRGARAFLRHVVANDVARLASPGKALYGALLNEEGGVVDDVIVYRLPDRYRVVSNAGTRERVVPWLSNRAGAFEVALRERRDLAMLAVQGPQALGRFREATGRGEADGLGSFDACESGDWMIGRTGYTGEDGIEVLVPAEAAEALWESLLRAGVAPAGLGARDTLRLEAGLNLHGQDMDESVTPLESNMAWTVAWDPPERDFVGRAALEARRREAWREKLTGVVLEERGVLRRAMAVRTETDAGVLTSGAFSPTLGHGIGLARLPRSARGAVGIDVRGAARAGRIVRPPFVRHGKRVFK